jgi:serine/threonine-protein kinase TTK/MPS1
MFDQVNAWNSMLKACTEAKNQPIEADKLQSIQEFLSSPAVPSHSAQVLELWTRTCLAFQVFSLQSADQIREWYKKAKVSIAPSALSASAILFIQWAEFEMITGRMTKALSILQMALELEAQPSRNLQSAIAGIMEQNKIPSSLLALDQYFQVTDFESYREKLNNIFAGLSKAKEQYKLEEQDVAAQAEAEEVEQFTMDAYEKMEQRLKMFQETLNAASNETKTFLSPPTTKEQEDEEETIVISKHALTSTSSISKRITSTRARLDLSQLKPSIVDTTTEQPKIQTPQTAKVHIVETAFPTTPITLSPLTPAFSSAALPATSSPGSSNVQYIVSVNSESNCSEKRPKIIQINEKKFQILQLVGKGGSSKVYKVIGTDFQIYALKKVRLKGLDKATLEGYMNEIDLLHRLSSNPWIIRLLDTCIDKEKSILYLLMEYGEVDLASMLAEKKRQYTRLPSSDYSHVNFIRYFWEQILRSVASIHQQRIIHCDLKPANFLLVKGTLKLIDFGISKAIQSNETANVMRENQVGTVNYMAPEALGGSQGERLKIGRPSDVWSLGCILYEMVYGSPPFAEFNVVMRLQKIIDSTHKISFPQVEDDDLLQSIQGCLIREQTQRFTISQLLSHPFLKANSNKWPS